jgi:hypothetical protein
MTHTNGPLFKTHLSLICLMVLVIASPVSAGWKEKVLYSFQGSSDGQTPAGGVVFDKAGNLYGATVDGGADNCSPMAACGTVFQLQPPAKKGDAWTETVLYVFKGKASNDGENPDGGLVIDAAGNLYGATAYGGTGDCVLLGVKGGCGTVYEMYPPVQKGDAWKETILYSFKGGKDGYVPQGNLVFDSAGNLYGATLFGGGKGTTCDPFYQYCGTVFELSPPKRKGGEWTEKVLHSFAGGTDGANPNGGLVLDGTGAIYGTTAAGGNNNCKTTASVGCGTAFQLMPSIKQSESWTEKRLHVFTGGTDGGQPSAGLIFNSRGSLYGVAGGGNVTGGGIVFRLMPGKGAEWKETVLHWFSNDGPGPPLASLIFDSLGNLYGTTGPGSQYGTVFRLEPPARKGAAWTVEVLYAFPGVPNGRLPDANIVFDQVDNLYSTTTQGGTGACTFGCGTVLKVSP